MITSWHNIGDSTIALDDAGRVVGMIRWLERPKPPPEIRPPRRGVEVARIDVIDKRIRERDQRRSERRRAGRKIQKNKEANLT